MILHVLYLIRIYSDFRTKVLQFNIHPNQEKHTKMQKVSEGFHFQNFISFSLMLMPGGRARGNPAQIFFKNVSKFLSIDLKNSLLFDIPIWPSFKWHMNFGPALQGCYFSFCGAQWFLQIPSGTFRFLQIP